MQNREYLFKNTLTFYLKTPLFFIELNIRWRENGWSEELFGWKFKQDFTEVVNFTKFCAWTLTVLFDEFISDGIVEFGYRIN